MPRACAAGLRWSEAAARAMGRVERWDGASRAALARLQRQARARGHGVERRGRLNSGEKYGASRAARISIRTQPVAEPDNGRLTTETGHRDRATRSASRAPGLRAAPVRGRGALPSEVFRNLTAGRSSSAS